MANFSSQHISPCGSISVLRYIILLETTCALAHIGATSHTSRFYAIMFLALLLGRSFVLILTIVQLDITLEFYFFIFYFYFF